MSEINVFEMREDAEIARQRYNSHRPDATRDAYVLAGYVLTLLAERDALAARVAALEGALRPAWEGDTEPDAAWASDGHGYVYPTLEGGYALAACASGETAAHIVRCVSAVRAARAALAGEEAQP